jgi:hypothetical protein
MKSRFRITLLTLTLLLLQGCSNSEHSEKEALKALLDNCEGDVGVSIMVKSIDIGSSQWLLTCSKTSQAMVDTIMRNVD